MSSPSPRSTQAPAPPFPQEVTFEELEQWWTASAKNQPAEKPVRTLEDLCLGPIFPRLEPKPVHPVRRTPVRV